MQSTQRTITAKSYLKLLEYFVLLVSGLGVGVYQVYGAVVVMSPDQL